MPVREPAGLAISISGCSAGQQPGQGDRAQPPARPSRAKSRAGRSRCRDAQDAGLRSSPAAPSRARWPRPRPVQDRCSPASPRRRTRKSGSRPCGPSARSALSRSAFATAGTSGRSTRSGRAAAARSPRSPRRRLRRPRPRCPDDAAVIAELVAAARDAVRHLRVLLEPGPDGKHRDTRSRPLCLGEQVVGHRYRPLTMEGERYPGPVTWPVYDLWTERHPGASGQAADGDGVVGDDAERLGGSLPCRVLVHPAMPAPVTTAPPRSKNSRRSMDTPRKLLTLGQPRRALAAGNVRSRTRRRSCVTELSDPGVLRRWALGERHGGIKLGPPARASR